MVSFSVTFPSLPKEIVFAVQSPLSRKTFLCQITFALAALHALDVPGSVQHVEQKAVQDRPLAAGAVDHGFGWAATPQMKHAREQNQQHRPSIDRVSAFLPPRFAWSSRVNVRGEASRSGVTTDFSLHA